jgi:hypothetical protein
VLTGTVVLMSVRRGTDLSHFEDEYLPRGSDAARLYGAKDIGALFPEGKEIASTPWGMAGRRKDRQDYDPDLVRDAIRAPAEHLVDVDPRHLRATQPMVTRGGVDYYMNDPAWRETGRTYAEQGNPGNAFPVVYSRHNEFRQADWQPEYEHLLLSGHHRGTAALLQGKQFKARQVVGGFGPPRR